MHPLKSLTTESRVRTGVVIRMDYRYHFGYIQDRDGKKFFFRFEKIAGYTGIKNLRKLTAFSPLEGFRQGIRVRFTVIKEEIVASVMPIRDIQEQQ